MKLYALCSARSEIQDIHLLEPGHEPIKLKFGLPENAVPLTIEYQQAIDNPHTGKVMTPASVLVHYLVPCDENGSPLCEICNENVADHGTICKECEDYIKASEESIESADSDESASDQNSDNSNN
jgi:hypothetical protein